jgi:hypothetical protein
VIPVLVQRFLKGLLRTVEKGSDFCKPVLFLADGVVYDTSADSEMRGAVDTFTVSGCAQPRCVTRSDPLSSPPHPPLSPRFGSSLF